MTELIFITSTGTDIGKTFVTRLMIQQLKKEGKTVRAFKPIISGVTDENIAASDTGLILKALGQEITKENIQKISPWRFKEPLSPHDAARMEKQKIDFKALLNFTKDIYDAAISDNIDVVLIETVGGLMVPLSYEKTIIDWICAFDGKVILVIANYLGTLSHSLTALHVCKNYNVQIKNIILSCYNDLQPVVEINKTARTIRKFYPHAPLIILPELQKCEFNII